MNVKPSASIVDVPKTPGIKVCKEYVLALPKKAGKIKPKKIKDLFDVKAVVEIFDSCGLSNYPTPTKAVGAGGYGKAFELMGGNMIAKFQVFPLSKIDNQTGEVFLNRLFARNGISPRVQEAIMLYTSNRNMGASVIIMDKHFSLSAALKGTNGDGRKAIMARIRPQVKSHLNKMLTLGFACVDLKPSNALYSLETRRVYMIDFSPSLCPQAPVLIDNFARRHSENRIASTLPIRLRRSIIATQLIFFHVTCREFTRSMFDLSEMKRIANSRNSGPIRFAYSVLIRREVPPAFENLTKSELTNMQIVDFIENFARGASINFRHYSSLDENTSFQEFVEFLLLEI